MARSGSCAGRRAFGHLFAPSRGISLPPLPTLSPDALRRRTRPLAERLGRHSLEPGEVVALDQAALESLLEETDEALVRALYIHADSVCERFYQGKVHFRGLIEFSNVCRKDCGYCGIRKRMASVKRYTMSKEQIVDIARWAHEQQYGSVMLQSGELLSESRLNFLCDVIHSIRRETEAMDHSSGRAPQPSGQRGLGVALSVGELPRTHYRALKDAGAHRYLLRIETSNPELYARLHPQDSLHSWHTRYRCIKEAQNLGFQVGTGVMIGVPHQTVADQARDLLFFRDEGVDMVGMGPYVYEPGTPVGDMWLAEMKSRGMDKDAYKEWVFERTTRMTALARVTLGDVNIAATTALQAIRADGREVALRRGANILMPILTPADARQHYQLYEGKPCLDETATQCRACLELRVNTAGKEIAWGEWGDPVHFWSARGRGAGES